MSDLSDKRQIFLIKFAQKDKSDDTRPLEEDDMINAIKKEDRDGL